MRSRRGPVALLSSLGARVYVPAWPLPSVVGVTSPNCWRWVAWGRLVPRPMMENGSPYSYDLQVSEYVTTVPASVQRSVEAWRTPKLCESSCAMWRRLGSPFIQDCELM